MKATEFGEKKREITQSMGHYAVQGHSMSPILVPIESLRLPISDYPVITLPPILHRFQVMVKFSIAREECLTLTLSLGMPISPQ